ncbi:hypothetical protein Cgig2_033088 [Carnegiea gigantea]|uniref:Uncharacterized protein n=1 Tax=Carnegiea gigantea TaxID=171969 RepID=A0A9Q1JNP9_9CARY|nr:hypothetical protein Cgig2_033088 [Carnegiea gigantea]
MKATEHHLEPIRCPKRDASALQEGDPKRIIKAKQALRKAHNSIAPSRPVTTLYASKSRGARWYEEQEESSRPCHPEVGGSKGRIPSLTKSVGRTLTGTRAPRVKRWIPKSHIRKLSQVMANRELRLLMGPTMTFGMEAMCPFRAPHNDILVIQLKMATVMFEMDDRRWENYMETKRWQGNAIYVHTTLARRPKGKINRSQEQILANKRKTNGRREVKTSHHDHQPLPQHRHQHGSPQDHPWVDPIGYTQGRMDGQQMPRLSESGQSLGKPPLSSGHER